MRIKCRLSIALIFSLSCGLVVAQERPRVYLGLTGDVHASQQINGNYSNSLLEDLPGVGWKIGLTGAFDIVPALTIAASVGGVGDVTRTNSIPQTIFIVGGGTRTPDTWNRKSKHTWLDGTATVLYKPMRKSSYSLLLGTGFSVRRLTNSVVFNDITSSATGDSFQSAFPQTDRLFPWNYVLTPKVGAEFYFQNNGKLQCFLEYQQGLRELYLPVEPPAGWPYNYAYPQSRHKLISGGISVAWMWGLARKQ